MRKVIRITKDIYNKSRVRNSGLAKRRGPKVIYISHEEAMATFKRLLERDAGLWKELGSE